MKKTAIFLHYLLVIMFFQLHDNALAQCSVTIAPVAPFCAGQSAVLDASAAGGTSPYTYLWNTAATTSSITVITGGTYSVTVTDAVLCTASASVLVTVNPLPNPLVSGQTCVCIDLSGVMYTTPFHAGSTYAWNVTGGTINTGQGSNQITVTWGNTPGAGSVSVTETLATTCFRTNVLPVTISNTFPSTTFTILNNNVCSGTTVNFQGPSGAGLTYLWNFGDPTSGSNTSTLQNPGHIFKTYGCGITSYNVTLVVTNGCGCSTAFPAQVVNIKHQPNPQLQDQDPISPFSNCDNNPTPANHDFLLEVNNITANTSCITGYTIDWGDGTILSYPAGFTSASHTYTDLGAFNLVFTATNGTTGCTNSITYIVANQSIPSVGISNNGGNTAGCYPVTFSFTILGAANNSPGTMYNISFGDGTILTKTNSELHVDSVVSHTYTSSSCGQGLPGNQYTVIVAATNACNTTVEATVNSIKVYKPPVAAFTTTPADIGCVNTNFCVTNTSTPGYGFNCNQVTSWSWSFGDPGSTNNTSTQPTPPCHIYTTPGTYTITLTANNDQCPTPSEFSKQICINPSPDASFTVDTDLGCNPLTVNAVNTSTTPNTCGDLTYTWGVSFNGAGTCTPSPGNWAFAGGSNSHSQHASFTFADPGTYTITLTVQNSCTAVTSTKVITVKSIPRVTVAAIPPSCALGVVNPTAIFESCYGSITAYNWTFPGGSPATANTQIPGTITYATSGDYTLTASATNECGVGSGTTNLTVNPIPVITTAPPDQTICSGSASQAVTLSSSVTPTTYHWTTVTTGGILGAPANGTANPIPAWTLTNPGISAGTVTVTVEPTASGCTGSTIDYVINVNPVPVIPNQPATICSGGSFAITPVNSPPSMIVPPGTTYSWPAPSGTGFTGGAPGSGENSITGTLINTTNVAQTATYTVVPTSGTTGNCTGNAFTVTVVVNPKPIIPDQTVTVCSGTAFSITPANAPPLVIVPAGTTYSWAVPTGTGFTGGSIGTGQSSVTGTLTNLTGVPQTATYTVTPVAGSCTGETFTVTVNLDPVPAISAGPDQSIAYGTSTTLSGSASGGTGALTYAWMPAGSIASGGNTLTPTTTNLYTATSFTLTVTDIKGCSSNDQAVVTLNGNPLSVSVSAVPNVICNDNTTVQLSSSGSGGSGVYTYSWSSVPAGYSSTQQNPAVNPVVTTIYTVTVNDGFNNANNSVTVTVNPLPSLYLMTGGGEYCAGGAGRAVGLSGSQTGIIYQCYKDGLPDGSPVTGSGGAISFGNKTAAGNYTAKAANAATNCQQDMSGSVAVLINPVPVINAGPDLLIAYGTSTMLTGTATGGTGALAYAWTPAGSIASGGNTLTPTTTNLYSSTTFTLNVTDLKGCSASDQAIVTLNGNPLSVAVSAVPNVICNDNTSIQLNAAGSGGSGVYTYSWSSVPAGYSSTQQNPTVNPVVTTIYTVTVNDGFNNANNSVTVTVNPLPTVYIMTGGGEYCAGGAGRAVGLSGSQAGTIYQCYKDGLPDGSPVTGGGGALSFGNKTVAGNYTAKATNPATNCQQDMSGSVQISINPLPLVNAGFDRTIPYGTSTTLSGAASGGTGTLTYAWSPMSSIASGGTTLSPLTTNIYANTTFTLSVSDIKGCVNTDDMQVVVSGDPLTVNVSAFPDVICAGETAQLTAAASGGSGNYTYSWSCLPPGTPPWNSNQQNPQVSPPVTTDYTVLVNDGYNTITASVVLTVNPLPIPYDLTGGGSYCFGGAGVPIGLANSESGVVYQLFRGSTGLLPVVDGTGAEISFGNHTIEASYTVKATVILTGCENNMNGNVTVTILPLPLSYTVTGGGSYPSGGTGVPVGLSDSEIGINYMLFHDNNPVIPLPGVAGTGDAITFGYQTLAGSYTVVATNAVTGCFATMNGSVNVVINPWPSQFDVFGGGTLCYGEAGKEIGLSGSEIGIRYVLRRNNDSIDQFMGTGDSLHFGIYNTGGSYTVKGVTTATGLSKMMNGSALIIVNQLPLAYILIPQGDTCLGTEVLINGSQAGINYYLIRGTDTVTMVAGTGSFGLLTFGHQSVTGTYRVVGINPVTGCKTDMLGTVTLHPLPEIYQVLPPGILCPGEPVLLSGTQVGILYQLRRDSLINVGAPIAGTGSFIDFGPQFIPGEYRVVAFNTVTHCYSWMNGDATIQPAPVVFNILPSGDTCSPAVVRLNGSQTGVSYRLVFNNTVYLDSLYGTGQPLIFGTYSTAGVYNIIAIDTLTHCEYWMSGSIQIFASPVGYNIIPNGVVCANTEVGLDGSQTGFSYMLYRDVWILAGGPLPGTGNPVSFGVQAYPGAYTIQGVSATTTCSAGMNGSAILSPLPLVYNIQPEGNRCPGTDIYLNGSEVGVIYRLLRDNIIQVSAAGTGSMLHFGPQFITGNYTVEAVSVATGCDTLMTGAVNMLPGPLAYTMTPAGINCSPAVIGLTVSDIGIRYQLRRDSLINVGPPLYGTGSALDFGAQSLPGVYRIIADNPSTGCFSWMNDSVTIRQPAVAYNMIPSGDTCSPAMVRLNGSQAGNNYRLVLNGTINLGSLQGTGQPLVFGTYQTSGIYRIVAVDTLSGCEFPMTDSLRIFAAPEKFNLVPQGIACANMIVGLDDSEIGVNYTLIRNGWIIAAGPLPGTGSAISFGNQPYPGDYTAEGVFGVTTCRAFMNGSATLNPLPFSFLLQPPGDQCAGTDLYLNGSEVGVNYQLLRDNLVVTTRPGTGDLVRFGVQYLVGNYTVRAVNALSFCDTLMTGTTTILPLPLPFDITPAGANCSPVAIGLAGSQAGVSYQLYKDGFASGPPVAGTGSSITFGLHPAGNYLVIAVASVTMCTDTMPGQVLVTNGPVVNAGNDATICASHTLQLSAIATDFSAVLWYTLGDGNFSDPAILDPVYFPGMTDVANGTAKVIIKVFGSPACLDKTATDTVSITINPLPVVSAGLDDTICVTGTIALNGSAQHFSTCQWHTSGDGTFDNAATLDPVYTPGTLDKQAGSVILRLVVHGSLTCQADTISDSMRLVIDLLPVSNAGSDVSACENWSYRLAGDAQHHSSVQWSTLGDGTFDDPALPDALYTPGPNDRIVGSVRLVMTAFGSARCSAEADADTMRLTLNKLPVVIAGPDITICSNQHYQCAASVQRYSGLEWTTAGDGIFSNRYISNPIYTPGPLDLLTGSVWLKIAATGLLTCATETVSDSLMVSFYQMPSANAGNDSLTCPNIQVQVHGTALHYNAVLWSTLGNGAFDNPGIMEPFYTPGSADVQAGYVDLVMTVNGEAQCSPMIDRDTVRLNFRPLPAVSLTGTAVICEGATGNLVMHLSGVPPWSVSYTNGTNNFTINNIPSGSYTLNVNPVVSTTYTILALADANCSVISAGPSFTVIVNPLPETFLMTATNGGGYCEGYAGVELGIDGSQPGIFYQLLLGGIPSGFPMPGTGGPVSFGWKTIPGIYQVRARHPQTFCEVVFSDSIAVTVFPIPMVDFTSDSACLGQPTQFHLTGPDIGKIASWLWNFGDGNNAAYSAPVEPLHMYTTAGTFNVSLTVTDTNDCVRTFAHPVLVSELPVALFSHDAPLCSGYTVHFSDHSYAPSNSYLQRWHWEFGDGTDTLVIWPDLPDVSHVYNNPATYAAVLTVTTNHGCSAGKVRTIEISPAPVANFTYTNACEMENVTFTDISQLQGGGAVVEWEWNFGDPLSGLNNTAFTHAPTHLFSSAGSFEVRLIVMNTGGCFDTITKNITVHSAPRPAFTFNTACLGSITQFTDITTPNSNIEWLWDFGDGSPGSTSQNPIHIYANPGVYAVTLTVKNSDFCSHDTTLNVSVIPLPTAGFQTNAPMCNGSAVTFTNTSTTQHGLIVRWTWDFGDGSDTTINFPGIPNVTHVFAGTSAQYLVKLTVKTSDSCTSFVEHLVQSVAGPVAAFAYSSTLCPGVNVLFTDQSQLNGGGPIAGWYWNFNDPTSGSNNISTLQNPVHAFTGPGIFNVKLVITNGGNCRDSLVKQVIINTLPVSGFTFDTVCKGVVTHFTDLSTTSPGTILTWDWDFGDGQPHANVPNPAHLYAAAGAYTVTLTVMNSGHCTSTVTRLVHVNPLPVAAFSSSNVNCSGSYVSFTDMSTTPHGYILQWAWNFGDGHDTIVNFPGISPVNHIYATGGTYTVVLSVKTSDSCTASVANQVTVYNQPLANFSFSAANCQSTPVQFTDLSQPNGSGVIISWNWDFGDPGSGTNNQSTLQNPVHTFQGSGPYNVRLIVHNAHQCSDTIMKTLNINANPVADFTADTVCQGSLMHFTDASLSTAGVIVSWLWDFGDGSTPGTVQNPTHLYATPGIFMVSLSVMTDLGCQHQTSHQVLVKVPPFAMFTHSGHCVGALTQFTDQSTTSMGSISGWDWDFGDGSTAVVPDPAHQYTGAGTYNVRLIVTNTGGCHDTVTIPVVIFQRPTADFSYFSPNCPAGKVTFTDHSIGSGSPVNSWYWLFEPGFFSTSPNPTYTYTHTDSSYLVSLVIHDMNGCADTLDSLIYVTPGFAFTFNATSACLGTPTQFHPVNLAAGDTLRDLLWTFGEPSSAGNTSSLYSPTHTYALAQTYIVKLRAYNSDNCHDSVFREVTVFPLPAVDISCDAGAHCDSLITFRQSSSGNGAAMDSLCVQFGDGSDTTFIPPLPGTFIHRYAGYGLFTAVATAYNQRGCNALDSITVNVSCVSASFTNPDTLVCQRTRVVLFDSSTPQNLIKTWTWDFGDGADTTYSKHCDMVSHTYQTAGSFVVTLVVRAQSNGFWVPDTSFLDITVKPSPVSDFSVENICNGDTSRFVNLSDSNGTHIITTQWKFADPGSSGHDTSTLTDPVYKYISPGRHKVRLISINQLGCADTLLKEARVYRLPQAVFNAPIACERYDLAFSDKSVQGDTTIVRWQWNFGNPEQPFDTVFGKNAINRYEHSGRYNVNLRVEDVYGCRDTVTNPVDVMTSPVAAFTITDNFEGIPGQIRLNNTSSDSIVSYNWTFAPGNYSKLKDPVFLYSEDGEHMIQLIVRSANGCYDTTYMDYEFMFENLFVPNAFSPTSVVETTKGLEIREFLPKGLNLKDYHVMVFDKWGHLVWESNLLTDDGKGMPAEGWDGTFNGELMPQDVYMWKISATFRNGKIWEGSDTGKGSTTTMGTVTLIR